MKLGRQELTRLIVFFDTIAFILLFIAIFAPGWWRIEYTQTVIDFSSKTDISQTTETTAGLDKLKIYLGYRKKPETVKLSYSIFYVKKCTSEVCLSLEFSDLCTKHFDSCSDGSPNYMSILVDSIICLITTICGFTGSVLFYRWLVKRPENLTTNPTVLKGGAIALVLRLIGVITGIILLVEMHKAIAKGFGEISKLSDLSNFTELSQYSVTMMTIGIVVMFKISIYHVFVLRKLYRGDNFSNTLFIVF